MADDKQEMRRNLRIGEHVRNGLFLICIIYRVAIGNVTPLGEICTDAICINRVLKLLPAPLVSLADSFTDL